MHVPPRDDFAKTFSQKSPWREVKGKPLAPLEGTTGDWEGYQ